MVIDTVIQIKLKKGEAVERALRRLKKIMDKEGMMKQLRANRYYEKPSEKKRRKSARARSRILSGR
jgi:small subunit ribosomal protein S21